MAQSVVRDLEEDVKIRLQQRARRHGRSMEAEIRDILRSAVADRPSEPARLGTRTAHRFSRIGLDASIEELRDWEIDAPDFRA